jgi:hypothetical protein
MIEVSTLCCKSGDINVETDENDPEQRKLLAEQIVGMLTKGALISVTNAEGETFRIFGYDAEKNEWLLNAKSKGKNQGTQRKPASKSKVTVVAPISGG